MALIERSHPTLAENDVVVAPKQDVLGGKQPLLDRRGESALEEHRNAHCPNFAQERKVLHVARTDLQHVRVLRNPLDIPRIHHFRDDAQAIAIARLAKHLEGVFAEALKRVRRRARLISAPA